MNALIIFVVSGRSFELSKCRLEVEPDVAIRLFVAMSALPLLILEVKAEKIADRCIRRGDLPVVDLLATLVQKADGIVLIRRFGGFETLLAFARDRVPDPPNLAAQIRFRGPAFALSHARILHSFAGRSIDITIQIPAIKAQFSIDSSARHVDTGLVSQRVF